MQIEQIALQLYTLRDHLKTPEAYASTLERVAAIGYRAVEMAGPRPLPEAELAELCRQKGLVICSAHESPTTILKKPQSVIRNLNAFGCTYAVYPYPEKIDLHKSKDLRRLVEGLEASGSVLARAEKTLAYHNHATELEPVDGIPILEVIYGNTEANHLQGQLDTYWVHVGDSSPQAWCARLRDRLPLIHLKDCRFDADGKPQFAEVGHGVLDWQTICATAEACGCRWFIVEQDTCLGDPFESVEMSFRYLRETFC